MKSWFNALGDHAWTVGYIAFVVTLILIISIIELLH